ncbi:Rieske (2Fe-2S) protein [Arthrobacter sp. KK5.5]|uniref:Rieske (2Fe-2S) protein n=1 Tax=Arthrobacter sp. KK5.5 TaxID=3373084 RepID=UPI003EE56DAB
MNEITAGRPARRIVLGSSLAVGATCALAACGGGGGSASSEAPSATGEGTEAATTEELQVGGSMSVDLDGKNYLLHRPDEATVLAYSSVCTHEGCQVGIGAENFSCPCHGSEFAMADGARVAGPAKDPLARYAAEIDGDKVIVYL